MRRPPMFAAEHARAFDDEEVARRYSLRRTYPDATIDALAPLVADEPRRVLDAGCGTGDVARRLARHAGGVDALDPSEAMLRAARALPGGEDARIRWLRGTAEDAPLDPPYALVTCGQSLHWMDWDRVMPRFAAALTRRGMLAILDVEERAPWSDALRTIVARYSANRDHRTFDLVAELEDRGQFAREGEHRASQRVRQPRDDYIASHHAMSGLAIHRIGPAAARRFDAEAREVLAPYGEPLEFDVVGTAVWGKPS